MQTICLALLKFLSLHRIALAWCLYALQRDISLARWDPYRSRRIRIDPYGLSENKVSDLNENFQRLEFLESNVRVGTHIAAFFQRICYLCIYCGFTGQVPPSFIGKFLQLGITLIMVGLSYNFRIQNNQNRKTVQDLQLNLYSAYLNEP